MDAKTLKYLVFRPHKLLLEFTVDKSTVLLYSKSKDCKPER